MTLSWRRAALVKLVAALVLFATGCVAGPIYVVNGGDNSVTMGWPAQSTLVGSGSGSLNDARGVAAGGVDGALYVSGNIGGTQGAIFRYNAATGAFIGIFANTVDASPYGIAFGPDGNLYVANSLSNSVSRFDANTGTLLDTFVYPGSGGLSIPTGLEFGNGYLYVSSAGSHQVIRYNDTTGAFIDVLANGVDARGLTFGGNDTLLVADYGGDAILAYNAFTGASLGAFAMGGLLDGPVGLAFENGAGFPLLWEGLFVSSSNNGLLLNYKGDQPTIVASGLKSPQLIVSIPEPGTIVLLGIGIGGFWFSRRKRDGR